MFDCPEASQTSPTSKSLTVSVFAPRAVRVSGSLVALSGSSLTDHLPSAPAFAVAV